MVGKRGADEMRHQGLVLLCLVALRLLPMYTTYLGPFIFGLTLFVCFHITATVCHDDILLVITYYLY